MATKSSRHSINIDQETLTVLSLLAKQKKKTIPTLAKELILEALERQEDMALSALAESRETTNKKKKMVSHEDAWK